METTTLDPTSFIDFQPDFLDKERSDKILEYLLNLDWKVVPRTNNEGVTYNLPRLQQWMANQGVNARLYQKGDPLPWHELIIGVKTELEKLYHPSTFDYVLMNFYRNGDDKIGLHNDEEALGDENNVIASLSFGATRRFIVVPMKGKKPKYKFDLTHGSLVVMRGDTQKGWKHMIPGEPGLKEPRVNLTFRKA
jgi:alkylated DNA repair dioxygenase AlkB